ncbi:MAG: threonine synthase [Oscillospiraceae bacterium]|nr:threonine synthase [Oscillospiraceae bacterium]
MHYVSTRNDTFTCSASEAIIKGLAPDGGLLAPEVFPRLPHNGLETMRDMSYQQRAVYIMNLFLEGFTVAELTRFTREAYGSDHFDHPSIAPLVPLGDGVFCLELWHGPTCAFKDMALQMLPYLLTASLTKNRENKTALILVATSGDTGKAALEGFRDVPRTNILVFYPQNGVSAIQELQMVTQMGKNVAVCAVEGNFDDAQSGVKRIFSSATLREKLTEQGFFLSSANSINWGRLLPQIVYYISAYCDLLREGKISAGNKINVCVPTGNFGNILSAYYAKRMGLPIDRLICASNENNVLTDFIQTGIYDRNRPFHNTISPSMDILVSSNLERLLFALARGRAPEVRAYMESLAETGRYQVRPELFKEIETQFCGGYCNDKNTRLVIRQVWESARYLIDPHTAVAFNVLARYRAETGDRTPTVVVSTASPFKFCDSVLEALGEQNITKGVEVIDQLSQHTGIPAPAPLAALKNSTVRFKGSIAKEDMAEAVLKSLL